MNLATTQYNLENKTLEIYLSGCNVYCKNCHNPELWDFNYGNKINNETIEDLIKKINASPDLIETVWLLGGEPLAQNLFDLIYFITKIQSETKVKWWLWTSYEYDKIPLAIRDLNLFDYIKCGKYIDEKRTDGNIQFGIKLASSNQYIKKVK